MSRQSWAGVLVRMGVVAGLSLWPAATMAATDADAALPGTAPAANVPAAPGLAFANPRAAHWAGTFFLADCLSPAFGGAALLWERLAQVPADTARGSALLKFIDAAVEAVARGGPPVARCPPQPPQLAVNFAPLAAHARGDAAWGNLLARLCTAMQTRPLQAAAVPAAALWQPEVRWRCTLALATLQRPYSGARRALLRQADVLQAQLPAARQAMLLRAADVRRLRHDLGHLGPARVLSPASAAAPVRRRH